MGVSDSDRAKRMTKDLERKGLMPGVKVGEGKEEIRRERRRGRGARGEHNLDRGGRKGSEAIISLSCHQGSQFR